MVQRANMSLLTHGSESKYVVINEWFREQISSYQRMVQRADMSLLTHGSESKYVVINAWFREKICRY